MADLALLPNVLWTPDGGALENAIDGVRATITGGSTLLANAKFRNDYQRLTSTFPGLAYRASGAVTNLLYALNADAPSFEGGTVGGWTLADFGTGSVDSTWSTHGVNSNKVTVGAGTGGWAGQVLNVAAATANNTQYTFAARVKSNVAKTIRVALYDEVDGYTATNYAFAAGEERLLAVTKTFDPTDTAVIRRAHIQFVGTAAAGDIFYMDSLILTAGATVPQFEESQCVATTCTFPTPFTAGSPFSAVFFVWTPYAGNDGVLHTIFDSQGTAANQNRILVQKTAANNLEFNIWDNATNLKQCSEAVTAVNWPAGTMKRVTISRDAGVMNAFLNGVVFGTLNAGAGTGLESALGANSYIGTDNAGANPLNGLILPFIYGGVAWGDAECQYISSGAVTPYSPDRSAMYCHHPNKAIYALKAPYQYIDARRDN